MAQAKSQVQVTIGGRLDPSYGQAFSAADKKQAEFAAKTGELNKKLGDVAAFRRQQNALKEAATAYTQARQKVASLKAELAATDAPTRKQAAALAAAERAAARAGAAYTQARTRLSDMSRELQRNGVNVTKLSSEYRRLQDQLRATNQQHLQHERTLQRQQRIVAAMRTSWEGIGKTIAGATAAAMVLKPGFDKAMNWEERLAYMADTAGAGKSVEEKRAIFGRLSDAVNRTQKSVSGSKRDDIAEILNTLIATGGMSEAEAIAQLTPVARAQFAAKSTGEEAANIAIKAQQFGVDPATAMDMAMRAGAAGGVEFKHMAKFLPEQMASAKAAGYSGKEGLAQLLSMNELALRTSGSPEQAANNVQNFLNKLIAPELAGNIKKVAGVDWNKYKLEQKAKGVSAGDAFLKLAEQKLAKDPKYTALQKQLAGAKSNEEKSKILGEMSAIMEGSQMGQFIQDRQALASALSGKYARQEMAANGQTVAQKMYSDILSGPGGVAGSAEFLGGMNFAKQQNVSEAVSRANEQAYGSASPAVGALMDGISKLANAFPTLTAAVYSAASVFASIAAFGIGGAIFGKMTGAGAGAAGAAGAAGVGGGLLAAGKGFLTSPLGKAGVAGVASWGALQVAEAAGLPNVDQQKGQEALKRGDWLGASAYLPAGDFLGAVFAKMTGGNPAGDSQVTDAAKAAAAAAVAAAPQPNITQNFNNNIPVTINEAKDGKKLSAELERELERINRRQAAAARSGFMGTPEN